MPHPFPQPEPTATPPHYKETAIPVVAPNAPRQRVFITGGSSGIGAALARHYASRGAALILTGRNIERLDAVAEDCTRLGSPSVVCSTISVTDKGGFRRFIEKEDERHPITHAFANAGISSGTGEQKSEGQAQTEHIFATNVQGVFNTIFPLIPLMQERGAGHIGIVSSLASFKGIPGAPAYCGSKAAIRVWAEGLRGNLAPDGIHVSIICPGFVRSRITDSNDFKMPFFMEADKAAAIIAKGIHKKKARIAFPWQMATFVWIFNATPLGIVEKIARLLPKKPAARDTVPPNMQE
jgi:short-subunit dehydrogenase